MIHQLGARLYERLTGRPYWTHTHPVDLATLVRIDGLGPCQSIAEHLAIGPVPGGWPYVFRLVHVPSGRPLVGGTGCITCCRRAGRFLASTGANWSTLRLDNTAAWLAAAPEDTQRAIASLRLGLDCTAGPHGQTCPDGPRVHVDEDLAVAA